MRNVGWAVAITIAVFVHHIGELSSARAESKTSTKGSSAGSVLAPHWNHNGSLVSLVSQGAKQKFFYDTPRVGLLDAGVKPGTLLFEGQRNGQNFDGTAFQFYRTCKSRGFPVTGSTSDDRKTITLKGKAPLLDMNCNVTGSRDDVLIFTASQIAPSEPPKETPVASSSGTKAAAQTPSDQASSVVVDTKNSALAAAVLPSAPAVEGSNAKSGESSSANKTASVTGADLPSEPAKDKQVTGDAPKEEKVAVVPATEKVPPSGPPEDVKQPAATQTASITAKSSAAGSGAAPPSEPPKDTQVAAIPGAANNAAKTTEKTTEKTDDPSKSKNAATAAVVSAPSNLPSKSKSDDSKADGNKTPVVIENRAVPTSAPEKMMEIVLKNGRILRIGRDIEPEALARIILQLERL